MKLRSKTTQIFSAITGSLLMSNMSTYLIQCTQYIKITGSSACGLIVTSTNPASTSHERIVVMGRKQLGKLTLFWICMKFVRSNLLALGIPLSHLLVSIMQIAQKVILALPVSHPAPVTRHVIISQECVLVTVLLDGQEVTVRQVGLRSRVII